MAETLLQENRPASRVGPNAVIQLAAALRDRLGEQATNELFTRAGQHRYLVDPPDDMVDEKVAAGLFGCLFAALPAATAAAVAAEAGKRTADYILANRIPGPAQTLLKSLPPTFSGTAADGRHRKKRLDLRGLRQGQDRHHKHPATRPG